MEASDYELLCAVTFPLAYYAILVAMATLYKAFGEKDGKDD